MSLCERVTIGFGFTFDWTKKWRELFKPIVKRSGAKPITFRHKSGFQLSVSVVQPKQINALSHPISNRSKTKIKTKVIT